MCVSVSPGCLRSGGGGGVPLASPKPETTPAGYSLEGTSTTGTSTRAWEGAVGAGAPAGVPKKEKLPAFGGKT